MRMKKEDDPDDKKIFSLLMNSCALLAASCERLRFNVQTAKCFRLLDLLTAISQQLSFYSQLTAHPSHSPTGISFLHLHIWRRFSR